MKVLRATDYASPSERLATMVIRQKDANRPLEEVAQEAIGGPPRTFVVTDLFEVPDSEDTSLMACTARALERSDEEREQNMAIAFFWSVEKMLPILKADGVLAAPDPAPLTNVELGAVYEQIARHPNYDRQLVQSMTEDGYLVSISNGHVTRVKR